MVSALCCRGLVHIVDVSEILPTVVWMTVCIYMYIVTLYREKIEEGKRSESIDLTVNVNG